MAIGYEDYWQATNTGDQYDIVINNNPTQDILDEVNEELASNHYRNSFYTIEPINGENIKLIKNNDGTISLNCTKFRSGNSDCLLNIEGDSEFREYYTNTIITNISKLIITGSFDTKNLQVNNASLISVNNGNLTANKGITISRSGTVNTTGTITTTGISADNGKIQAGNLIASNLSIWNGSMVDVSKGTLTVNATDNT